MIPYPGVSFLPSEPGDYTIQVQKSGNEIPHGSKTVSVETIDVPNSTNNLCEFPVDIPGVNLPEDLPKLKATLKRPGSKREEPVTLNLLSDNTLSVSFVPKSPGEHQVHILKRHRPVPGSPFSISVTEEKPENPIGKPVSVALVDVPLRDLPRVQVFLQRPGSDTEEPITLKKNSDDSLSVSFVPMEPGTYKIHVRKNSKPLPGSPYEIEVIDDRVFNAPGGAPQGKEPSDKMPYSEAPREEALFTKEIAPGDEKLPVGRICDLDLEIPGFSLPRDFRKLSATLKRPSSKREEPINLELNPDKTLGKILMRGVSIGTLAQKCFFSQS
jgi:filamin